MKMQWFIFGMVFLLMISMLSGCGIAQEQYDAVVDDFNQAQQELQSVQTELQTTKAKMAELIQQVSADNCPDWFGELLRHSSRCPIKATLDDQIKKLMKQRN